MIPYAQLRLEERNAATPETAIRVWNLLHPPYAANAFTANVAPETTNQIAGSGQYEDVQDTITLTISGDLPSTCADAYHSLIGAIDQARRWRDGENVNPIVIVAELQCSAVGFTEAVITGPGDGQPPGSATPEPTVSGDPWMIPDVTITFRRRPLWLEPLFRIDTAFAAVATDDPQIRQITFVRDQGPTFAPAMLTVGDVNTNLAERDCYLFCAAADTRPATPRNTMALIDATRFGPTAGYTLVNDAANRPYNPSNNVLRYTPTGTGEALSAPVDFTNWDGNPAPARIWAAYAVVRNNSATTSWLLRAYFRREAAYAAPFATRQVLIPAGVGEPQIVPMGIAPQPMNGVPLTTTIQLGIQASAASGTLDISHLALIALDSPGVTMVRILAQSYYAGAVGAYVRHRDANMNRESFAFLRQSATVGIEYAPDVRYQIAPEIPAFDGNTDCVAPGTVMSALLLQTDGAAWTLPGPSFPSMSIVRRRAYRTPQ